MWVSKIKPLEDGFVSDNHWLDIEGQVGKYRIPHFLNWLNIKLAYGPITPLTEYKERSGSIPSQILCTNICSNKFYNNQQ